MALLELGELLQRERVDRPSRRSSRSSSRAGRGRHALGAPARSAASAASGSTSRSWRNISIADSSRSRARPRRPRRAGPLAGLVELRSAVARSVAARRAEPTAPAPSSLCRRRRSTSSAWWASTTARWASTAPPGGRAAERALDLGAALRPRFGPGVGGGRRSVSSGGLQELRPLAETGGADFEVAAAADEHGGPGVERLGASRQGGRRRPRPLAGLEVGQQRSSSAIRSLSTAMCPPARRRPGGQGAELDLGPRAARPAPEPEPRRRGDPGVVRLQGGRELVEVARRRPSSVAAPAGVRPGECSTALGATRRGASARAAAVTPDRAAPTASRRRRSGRRRASRRSASDAVGRRRRRRRASSTTDRVPSRRSSSARHGAGSADDVPPHRLARAGRRRHRAGQAERARHRSCRTGGALERPPRRGRVGRHDGGERLAERRPRPAGSQPASIRIRSSSVPRTPGARQALGPGAGVGGVEGQLQRLDARRPRRRGLASLLVRRVGRLDLRPSASRRSSARSISSTSGDLEQLDGVALVPSLVGLAASRRADRELAGPRGGRGAVGLGLVPPAGRPQLARTSATALDAAVAGIGSKARPPCRSSASAASSAATSPARGQRGRLGLDRRRARRRYRPRRASRLATTSASRSRPRSRSTPRRRSTITAASPRPARAAARHGRAGRSDRRRPGR